MSVQDWGAVGEIVGAIATVATLLYLAIQIRQSAALVSDSSADRRQFDALITMVVYIWLQGFETGRQERLIDNWDFTIRTHGFAKWWAEYAPIFKDPVRSLLDQRMREAAS